MTKGKRRYLLFALLAALAIVLVLYGPETYRQQIGWRFLRSADVAAEVERAVARNDFRFVGYTRDGLDVPGLDELVGPEAARARALEDKYGVRRLPGISCATGHGKYGEAARDYCLRYNALLLAKLAERGER